MNVRARPPILRLVLGFGILFAIPAVFASETHAQEPPEDPVCRSCSESMIQPDSLQDPYPVHYWPSSWPCTENPGGPRCRLCESTHCDSPEVAHFGPCPEEECEGVHHFAALSMLEAGDLAWFAWKATTEPQRYGFDPERVAFQVYDCQGRVVLHLPARLFSVASALPPTSGGSFVRPPPSDRLRVTAD